MKKYKLTNQDMTTHNGCKWELSVPKETDGNSGSLCNEHWLHYYHNTLLAVLLNPIHADIDHPRLFEVKALGKHLNDNGLKGGCTKMTLVKELKVPEITVNQQIAFAILCSLEVYKEPSYVKWANDWLSGVNRTASAARNAATDAADADDAARYAAARYAATDAATDAADADDAARYAARHAAADARYAAAARYVADAARHVATDARYAAAAARYVATRYAADIDLIKLAKKALKYK